MRMTLSPPTLPAPFIVGVARSGTTLLRFMLDRHPDLAIPAETHFIPAVLQTSPTGASLRSDEFVHRITSSFTWADFGLSKDDFCSAVAAIDPFSPADGLRAFYRLCAEAQNKPRWGDKTPTYTDSITAISALLPEAYFIHVIRDGRAVAASRRHLSFGPGPDIVSQSRDWGRKIRNARMQAASCSRYMEIRYEELVCHPEVVLRNICVRIGLTYSSAMVDYQTAAETRLAEFRDWQLASGELISAGEYRRAIHQRTLKPLDANRVDHWRHVLLPAEVAAFEMEEGPLLRELGYSLCTDAGG
jgi:hypothetical protein